MITVHHLDHSRSHRVLWLLEELGLAYEVVRYDRDPKTLLAPSSLQKVHPLGKSPVISDGDSTVAESGAILEYLVERHGGGRLVPTAGSAEHLRYRYFMHYAEGSLMPLLLVKLIANRVQSAKMPFFARPIARRIGGTLADTFVMPNLGRHLSFLDSELEGRTWFCGDDLSAADVQMSFPIEAAIKRAGRSVLPANLKRFVEQMHARPAYARALEKGGPVVLDP